LRKRHAVIENKIFHGLGQQLERVAYRIANILDPERGSSADSELPKPLPGEERQRHQDDVAALL